MKYVISIENQKINVPEAVGSSDENVKKAMAPYYPEVVNSLISRSQTDDEVTITIVKKAGSKGAPMVAALDYLIACDGGKNPAVVMHEKITAQGLIHDPYWLYEMEDQISEAIEAGNQQAEHVSTAMKRLKQSCAAAPALVVPGF